MPFESAFRKSSTWRKSAVQAAKHPDQKNDRQWDADEPKQQTASHNFLLQGPLNTAEITAETAQGSDLDRVVPAGAGCEPRRKSLVSRVVNPGPAVIWPVPFPGGVAEWLKAHAWKACIRETVSWVRIPLPPPNQQSIARTDHNFSLLASDGGWAEPFPTDPARSPDSEKNVCFRGISGHHFWQIACPLMTQSGSGIL